MNTHLSRRSFLSTLALAPFALKAGASRTLAASTLIHGEPVNLDHLAPLPPLKGDEPFVVGHSQPPRLGPVVTRTFNNMEWIKTGTGLDGNDTGHFAFNDVDDSVTPYLHGPKTLMWSLEPTHKWVQDGKTTIMRPRLFKARLQIDGRLVEAHNVRYEINIPRYDIEGTLDAAHKGRVVPVPNPTVTLTYQEMIYS